MTAFPPEPSGAEPSLAAAWGARLQALREAGLAARDPIGLAAAEALAQRLARHGGAVQRELQARLLRRLEALEAPSPALKAEGPGAPAAALPPLARGPAPGLAALRALNQSLREASPLDTGPAAQAAGAEGARAGAPPGGLRSVAGFRDSWVRLRAETRVSQALGRKPENAGPLNSHMLLLRSLDLMRGLSPDYLRRFVSHVDSLLWLEQATQKPVSGKAGARAAARPAAKPGSKTRPQGRASAARAPARPTPSDRRDPP